MSAPRKELTPRDQLFIFQDQTLRVQFQRITELKESQKDIPLSDRFFDAEIQRAHDFYMQLYNECKNHFDAMHAHERTIEAYAKTKNKLRAQIDSEQDLQILVADIPQVLATVEKQLPQLDSLITFLENLTALPKQSAVATEEGAALNGTFDQLAGLERQIIEIDNSIKRHRLEDPILSVSEKYPDSDEEKQKTITVTARGIFLSEIPQFIDEVSNMSNVSFCRLMYGRISPVEAKSTIGSSWRNSDEFEARLNECFAAILARHEQFLQFESHFRSIAYVVSKYDTVNIFHNTLNSCDSDLQKLRATFKDEMQKQMSDIIQDVNTLANTRLNELTKVNQFNKVTLDACIAHRQAILNRHHQILSYEKQLKQKHAPTNQPNADVSASVETSSTPSAPPASSPSDNAASVSSHHATVFSGSHEAKEAQPSPFEILKQALLSMLSQKYKNDMVVRKLLSRINHCLNQKELSRFLASVNQKNLLPPPDYALLPDKAAQLLMANDYNEQVKSIVDSTSIVSAIADAKAEYLRLTSPKPSLTAAHQATAKMKK